MSRQFYGSLNNRFEENKMFCEEIKVGTGMTEYHWSDRDAYEVVAVKDQKHVTVREYDHKKADDTPYSNNWILVSNENNPTIEMVKRGKYWYSEVTITPEQAKEIIDSNDIDARIWACQNNFNLPEIVESGKKKSTYHRMNVSFGTADYHYDYEF